MLLYVAVLMLLSFNCVHSNSHYPTAYAMRPQAAIKINNTDAEERYIKHLVDTNLYMTGWTRIAIWISTDMLHPKMVELCNKAHKAAGINATVDITNLDHYGTLKFVNVKHKRISSIYVVTCFRADEVFHLFDSSSEEDFKYDAENHSDHNHHIHHQPPKLDPLEPTTWYIARGTRDDCVFYVDKVPSRRGDPTYILEKEVCGLEEISNDLPRQQVKLAVNHTS